VREPLVIEQRTGARDERRRDRCVAVGFATRTNRGCATYIGCRSARAIARPLTLPGDADSRLNPYGVIESQSRRPIEPERVRRELHLPRNPNISWREHAVTPQTGAAHQRPRRVCHDRARLVAACSTRARRKRGTDREAHAAVAASADRQRSTRRSARARDRQRCGSPSRLRAGQTFYVNQLDVRAHLDAVTHDEGRRGLSESGDFATLPWGGVRLADEEPISCRRPTASSRDDASIATPPGCCSELLHDRTSRRRGAHDRRRRRGEQRSRAHEASERHLLRPKAARDSMDVRLRVAARLHGAKNFAEEALIELRTRCTRSARSRCSPAPSRFACAGR